ncbi:uncharacterized protein LOC117118769 [Anneissia japonica]|uniref:uncharacterized protein LOC117118769 n=1 Tax=Anneissia japonica TaxID=1529436 RepID=UPI0014255A5A|nr:uncharacterized protein LOC117118769 [Anneissia japonica]
MDSDFGCCLRLKDQRKWNIRMSRVEPDPLHIPIISKETRENRKEGKRHSREEGTLRDPDRNSSTQKRNGLVVKVSDTSNFTECDQCGSTIYKADGPIVERKCPLTRTWQFVKIFSPQALNVCEVEIFEANLGNAYFKTRTTTNEFGCKFGLNESTQRLCIRCAMRCLRDHRCESFEYDGDSQCQLQLERDQGEQLRNTRLWNANRIVHSR